MKPDILKVIPETIPQFLKDHPHWVVWKRTKRGDKWTKPPFDPKTGKRAKVNDPATWTDFDLAMFVYQKSDKFDGIGFMLTDALGLIGFDFDHCVDEAGGVDTRVLEWVETLDTYAEFSPSGDGLRVLAFGKLPEGKRKAGPFEVYDAGRYLTITGHRMDGSSDKIEHREGEVRKVYGAIFDSGDRKRPTERSEDPRNGIDEPDGDRLDRAFNSKRGATIRALYGGDWEGAGYGSQSEADLALCRHLAFWFGKSESDIDRVFRASGLMRGKWDTPVKRGGETYGAATIRKAVESTGAVYKGGPLVEGDQGKADIETDAQKREREEKTAQWWMDHLNEKHSVVMLGGKCCILNETFDPVIKRPDINFSGVNDFHHRYANKTVYDPKNGKPCSVSKLWFTGNRKQYDGVVFSPEREVPGYYNLWRGFSVEPKRGDCSLYKKHLLENVANGNEFHFKWMWAWFARIIQDPSGERPGTAIVFKSPKGGGKGSVMRPFEQMFGIHFFQCSNQKHITGQYNHHLKNVLMLFADEGFFAGSKQDEGVLKALITEPSIVVEPKGKDVFNVKNHVNLVMASNEDWVIPAGLGERRFFMLDFDKKYGEGDPFWAALHKQMGNGGAEALFYDLLHTDLSADTLKREGIDLRKAPKTDALMAQIERGLDPFQAWWLDMLYDGDNTGRGMWEKMVPCDELRTHYLNALADIGARSYRLTKKQFGRKVKSLCPDISRTNASTVNERGGRDKVYIFPDLDQCRNAFEVKLGMDILWDEEI